MEKMLHENEPSYAIMVVNPNDGGPCYEVQLRSEDQLQKAYQLATRYVDGSFTFYRIGGRNAV